MNTQLRILQAKRNLRLTKLAFKLNPVSLINVWGTSNDLQRYQDIQEAEDYNDETDKEIFKMFEEINWNDIEGINRTVENQV